MVVIVGGWCFDRRPAGRAGRARPVLTAAGVSDRCDLASADFFETVPGGGDIYVLAQILHDWPDRHALNILQICAAAMRPGARLLIVEQVLPSGGARNVVPAVMDINMLIMLGGQERTGDEYEALLEASGFTDTAVNTTSGMWSSLEATKR